MPGLRPRGAGAAAEQRGCRRGTSRATSTRRGRRSSPSLCAPRATPGSSSGRATGCRPTRRNLVRGRRPPRPRRPGSRLRRRPPARRHLLRSDRWRARGHGRAHPPALISSPLLPKIGCHPWHAEPVYQLFRLALLANAIERAGEVAATTVRVSYVAPSANRALWAAPGTAAFAAHAAHHGSNLARGWSALLRAPDRFVVIDSARFVALEPRTRNEFKARYGHIGVRRDTPRWPSRGGVRERQPAHGTPPGAAKDAARTECRARTPTSCSAAARQIGITGRGHDARLGADG